MVYEERSNIVPAHDLARRNRAATRHTTREHEDALLLAEKSLAINPKDAYEWYRKGAALSNLNRYEEAGKSFDKALEIQPDLTIGLYNKGSVLAALGEYNEALECFDKAIEIDPNDPRAWYRRGAALVNNLLDYEEAIASL